MLPVPHVHQSTRRRNAHGFTVPARQLWAVYVHEFSFADFRSNHFRAACINELECALRTCCRLRFRCIRERKCHNPSCNSGCNVPFVIFVHVNIIALKTLLCVSLHIVTSTRPRTVLIELIDASCEVQNLTRCPVCISVVAREPKPTVTITRNVL
jgi:hypothetical protein